MHPEFEMVIGLEVHCQLSTATKIFCGCPSKAPPGKSVADLAPNSQTCPICTAHPGTLPVLNRKVVEYAVMAGLATECRIQSPSILARKNYFYPDLPKGYQISQFENPICINGQINIETPQGLKVISIQRIHMEEDAGKNIHLDDCSLVNLNRAGVPLIEIVSAPDMRSPEEAGGYLRALYAIVTYLGICDGNMQEGNFRCDANVSVRKIGAKDYGTRVEIKNVNSFRFVEKAISYEASRQVQLIQSGGKIKQETRTYDADKDVTLSMRSKEEAQDYRYFPDPDLIPIHVDSTWLEKIKKSMPELPEQKSTRFVNVFGLSPYDAKTLTASKPLADFFEKVVNQVVEKDRSAVAKSAANLLTGEVTRLLKEDGIEIEKSRLSPTHLADLIRLILNGALSSTGAKQVIASVWKTGENVQALVESQGLKQVSDRGVLEAAVEKIIAAFPAQAAELRSGKDKLLGFFVGQVMKEMGGKANPALVGEILRGKLK